MSAVICRNENVLYVDFTHGWRKDAALIVDGIGPRKTYLEICAATLCEEDYYSLLEAIADPEAFMQCDEDIQLLASGYFEQMEMI